VAYAISAAYQQTLTVTILFDETYRYVPNLNKDRKYKLDSIKITITGSIKRDSLSGATITPGARIKEIVQENIIHPYKNCLLIQEANTFIVSDSILKRTVNTSDVNEISDDLKRCPIVKNPTVENLSTLFFNKLAPIMPKIGAQLVSVKIDSEGIKGSHSRYKISHYTM
ncbi:Hypothetical protein HVR_LOCUS1369, partial [uncultured virus]